ncbi:MAG: hypothetical protein KDB53_20975, partial [Planctomycetes bacterium]|nr:hypothetical protein [Planctomycetota bacterium]
MKNALIYSHDTYGLGHLRRSLLVAGAITREAPGAGVLIATGSPRAQAFTPPKGVGILSLPAVLKRADGSYRSRDLDLPLPRLLDMRARLILSAWRDLKPDLVFVDHSPLGVEGELIPLLDAIRASENRPQLVLGLRDIIDDAEVVHRSWQASGVYERLERDYDRVLVYGCERVQT